ncbi:hypothetical protein [Streptococcus ovis]|uniref:hypothetical protein n=1 Tax=Streptococcus ovis TaxID=82806 RepID=UPI00036BB84B|nr:hypothetical protein [Streptococcus ovis]
MPYESGGRADKLGNRYEFNWIVLKLIDIIAEKIEAIKIEPIGEEEQGVDVWIRYKDGHKEAQQCKGRNGSKEYWDLSDLNQKGILRSWKEHLEREPQIKVSLVSPLTFTNLSDLIYRAKTNDNTQSFIDYQIKTSSSIKRMFESYVKYFGLSIEKDISKIINFLSRTIIRQEPYPENEEFIKDKIGQYFVGDTVGIKSKFIDFILGGENYGRWITFKELELFIQKENIELRNLARDSRVMLRIKVLNAEYHYRFKTLSSGIKIRTELESCINYIQDGKSIIVHGKAGNGKSGLTQNIIDWCDKNNILHLDLKLDSHIPAHSSQRWGEELGFPASISYCLDAFSKEDHSVLILDQLDALRWTARNSKNSISTCLELIKEIQNINLERSKKISIVFICRTYDLENDSGIKSLFEKQNDDVEFWHRIEVNEFSEDEVQNILGNKYLTYPRKTKELLRTPSNLYIWEKISDETEYYQITSTYNLVDKWWRDLSEDCQDANISEEELNSLKATLVKQFTDTGEIVFSKRRIIGKERALRYLISQGMLMESTQKISFVHQSFLDCFVAEQMINDYYSGYDIDKILGEKSQQNPTRRYQFQIFLQSLLDESEEDFLKFGDGLINSDKIRFNFKYVFFELLRSIHKPSDKVLKYLGSLIQGTKFRNHLCSTVVSGHPVYVNFLVKEGILPNWIDENKTFVINLLSSISPNYTKNCVEFMSQAITNSDTKNEWRGCFYSDYHNDSEEFFRLRLYYWRNCVNQLDWFGDFYKNINSYTIEMLVLILDQYQGEDETDRFYSESKEFDEVSKEYIEHNYTHIVNCLLPFAVKFSKINAPKYNFALLERDEVQQFYINVLHEANKDFAHKEPEKFFKCYEDYMGTGDCFYNEIVLDALYFLPNNYADKCVEYLLTDFNKTLFEKSEGYERKMVLAKRLISKVSTNCSLELYKKLEYNIIHYQSPDYVRRLKSRIDTNKEQKGYRVYWPFWGELQYRLLSVLPEDRMSSHATELLKVLERSNHFNNSFYESHCGSVVSPLNGKVISYKAWERILLNKKDKGRSIWDDKQKYFISSSPAELSRNFRNVVSQEPYIYIPLFLKLSSNNEINRYYQDALLGGIADLEEISLDILTDIESTLLNCVDENSWENLYHFFQIIEKHPNIGWSIKILEKLDSYLKKIDLDNMDRFHEIKTMEDYRNQSYSTLRGHGIHALDKLLTSLPESLGYFRETIRLLVIDKKEYVRFNAIFLIATILELDREFAIDLFELVFDENEKMLAHWHSYYIFYRLYDDKREKIHGLLQLGFNSKDKLLIKQSSSLITEIYLNKGDMEMEVYSGSGYHSEIICQMAINYFKRTDCKEKSKKILFHYLSDDSMDHEKIFPQLFRDNLLDIDEDKELITLLLTSRYKRKLYYYFLKFLEKQVIISDYKEIIFETIPSVLSKDNELESVRYYDRLMEELLVRLLLNLYDEHKGDHIAEQCLDIIDQMFEEGFANSRLLVEELMQK